MFVDLVVSHLVNTAGSRGPRLAPPVRCRFLQPCRFGRSDGRQNSRTRANHRCGRGNILSRHILGSICIFCVIAVTRPAAAAPFVPPLETPAKHHVRPAHAPLVAVASAGQRILAVGLRGTIVYSDNRGASWSQATVPASSDLVSVDFPTPQKGWAVGHDGLILHSTDGGKTWIRRLDGRQASKRAVEHYSKHKDEAGQAVVLKQEERIMADAEQGGAPPFLDVMFENERSGFVVGAFNRIFRTEDGGQSWVPWMDRVENPQELHIYAIRRAGSQIYMAGEQGAVWIFDATAQRFVRASIPTKATFFGLLVAPDIVLAYGMRGAVFRSTDQGRTWGKVDVGSLAGITSGGVTGDGRLVLVGSSGEVWQSSEKGARFSRVGVATGIPSYFAVTGLGKQGLAFAGSTGVRVASLPNK
ncbi:WD40/YVTN/BNR-like repeat-containing protein [Massilia niabensis]|uniref:WD40/YVTN/BNR-like repeat-containing protein n=1 Tax=Massilia niabensis TaxID=544910 RepID=A0ABW0LBG4_9BURK